MNTSFLYRQLYRWYETEHRILPWRETTDPYCIWVSEIILQQTRVVQGISYYQRIIERFPTVMDMAYAEEAELLRLWQGLGYYSRARNMYKAAQQIREHSPYSGGKSFPSTYDELLTLPGVGEYTAGAIASFAYNLPYPALDGNVYRVLARLYDSDCVFNTSKGKRYFHSLAEELLDRQHPRLFNSAIMEFGALYCTPSSPDCVLCPLQVCCQAYVHNTVAFLPIRKPRPILRNRYLNYTIYLAPSIHPHSYQTLLYRRETNDIWKHLYEFILEESDRLLPSNNHFDFKHILSHQRLHARFHIKYTNKLPILDYAIAVDWNDLGDYALSRLTLKAIEQVTKNQN